MNPDVILCVLAVYAITLVVSQYGGPFGIFAKFRAKGWDAVSCFVCLSFWVGLIVAILSMLTFLEYAAVVGGAIALWKVSEK